MAFTRIKDDRNYRVAEDEPTLIGYTFCNENGDRLGDVDDLIADTDSMKVRFLIVSLDQGLLTSRKVIVPLRDVALDESAERVICTNCSEERLNSYATYDGGELPADLERRYTATFLPGTGVADRTTETTTRAETFNAPMTAEPEATTERAGFTEETRTTERAEAGEQRMELIEEELQVGKREVQVGDVTLHKTVTEEEVCEPVELRQERAVIERHAVNRPADHEINMQEQDIHVPLMGEEVVSKKVPVVREEISIRKETDVTRQDVCDTVRKEDVDTRGIEEVGKQEVMGKHDVTREEGWLKRPQQREAIEQSGLTDETERSA